MMGKMNQMLMMPQFRPDGSEGDTSLLFNSSSDLCSVVMPNYPGSLSFSSSGVNVRVPFTQSQREELEAQTVIFKYIMARVPVPQQLLTSMTNRVENLARTRGAKDMLDGFFRSSDPEPWRCKRTDGKKWRCSRDRDIDRKYCQRHSNKKRSRKLVKSIPNLFNHNNADMSLSPKTKAFKRCNQNQCSSSMVTPVVASHSQPRVLDWFMNGESASVAVSNQEWEEFMPFKLGLNSHTSKNDTHDVVKFPKPQQNESSFNLYRCGRQCQQRSHDHLGGALNSNLAAQETRPFIDAWSTERAGTNGIDEFGKRNRDSVVTFQQKKLPFSSLSLSMSAGVMNSEASDENANGVSDSERQNTTTQWMSPHFWMNSAPGGPLAEAMCLGVATSSSNTTSSNGCRSSNVDVRQEFDWIN